MGKTRLAQHWLAWSAGLVLMIPRCGGGANDRAAGGSGGPAGIDAGQADGSAVTAQRASDGGAEAGPAGDATVQQAPPDGGDWANQSQGAARCGDGVLGVGEACDDGNALPGDGCGPDCKLEQGWACPSGNLPCVEACGDGMVVGREVCDDRNRVEDDYCSNDCRRAGRCGDHVVQAGAGEDCDDANAVTESCAYGQSGCVVCDATCHAVAGGAASCGDSKVDTQSGEQCDDGNTVTESCPFGQMACTVCNASCRNVPGAASFCGDGVVDLVQGEQCDDGNVVTEACRYGQASCVVCDATCRSAPGATSLCGDTVRDAANGEECDDGNVLTEGCAYGQTSCKVCGHDCRESAGGTSFCGDGRIDVAHEEQCDDFNATPGDGCDGNCHTEYVESCGDGVLDTGEQCDDHNRANLDGCSAACRVETGWKCPTVAALCAEVCGDQLVVGAEPCDDGNAVDDDYCGNDCRVRHFCGDKAVQRGAGESCDDGNVVTESCGYGQSRCTVCDALCHSVAGATSDCGDRVVDAANQEQCDDGNAVTETCAYGAKSCTVCSATCQNTPGVTSYCGDGVVDAANQEQCDDGNAVTESCAHGAKSCTVCSATCQNTPGATSYCGDGIVDKGRGEACDDGNSATEPCPYGSQGCTVCTGSCVNGAGATSFCGDGVVDKANGEECEPASDMRCSPTTCKPSCDTIYIAYSTKGNVQLTGTQLALGDGTFPQTDGTLVVGVPAGPTGPVPGPAGVTYLRYPMSFNQHISTFGSVADISTRVVGTSSVCSGASPGICVPGTASNRCLLHAATLTLNAASGSFPNVVVPGLCPYGPNHGTNAWTPDNQQIARGAGPGCLEYSSQGTITCANTGAVGLCSMAGLAVGTTQVNDQWDQPGPTVEFSADFKSIRMYALGLSNGDGNPADKFEVAERIVARTWLNLEGTETSRSCEMKPTNCPTPGAY